LPLSETQESAVLARLNGTGDQGTFLDDLLDILKINEAHAQFLGGVAPVFGALNNLTQHASLGGRVELAQRSGPSITSSPASSQSLRFSYTPQATGGTGAITFRLEGQPSLMTLSGGVVSFTPRSNGPLTFDVVAADANGAIARQTLRLDVEGNGSSIHVVVTGTGSDDDDSGFVGLEGVAVELGVSGLAGATGARGGFGFNVPTYGGEMNEVVIAAMPLGSFPVARKDATGRLRIEQVASTHHARSPIVPLFQDAVFRTVVIVDAHVLKGNVTFVGDDGVPVDPSAEGVPTTWDSAASRLLQVSKEDVDTTECSFFKPADLERSIARLAVVSSSTPPAGAHGSFARLRIGPRELTSQERHAQGQIVDERVLHPGEPVVFFCVNHATGYAGMTTSTVPAGGLLSGPPEVIGNVKLFPPEIEVEVKRQLDPRGVPQRLEPSLVRSGGMATTSDRFLSVASRWRVRLKPNAADDVDAGVVADAGFLVAEAVDAGFVDGGTRVAALIDEGVIGEPLERSCSELPSDATPRERIDCLGRDDILVDVPSGIPPLAAHVVALSGAMPTLFFAIPPGKGTSTLDVARRFDGQSVLSLATGTYLVQAVGRRVAERDVDGDGTLSARELNQPPPDFAEDPLLVQRGFPKKALPLKGTYTARLRPESGGPVRKVPSFDTLREHTFRVVAVNNATVSAGNGAGTRELEQDDQEATARDTDTNYSLLLSLLEPPASQSEGRDFNKVGDYEVRFGGDEQGIDCTMTVDGSGPDKAIRGDCGDVSVPAIIGAHDVLYVELFLSGNTDNVLYRYNFYGLLPRKDTPTAQTARTADLATKPLRTDDTRVAEAAISRRAAAFFFLDPSEIRAGIVEICTNSSCDAGALLKVFDVESYDAVNAAYQIGDRSEGSVKELVEQLSLEGLGGSRYFQLPLPPDVAQMPGSPTEPKQVFVRYQRTTPNLSSLTRPFGVARGAYDSVSATATAQMVLAGVNVADGHLVRSIEDLTLPEKGVTRSFVRTYNNQRNEIGALGPGWMHSLEGYIHEERSGRYQVVLNGQSYDFETCNVTKTDAGAVTTITDCTAAKTHGATLAVAVTPSATNPAAYATFSAVFDAGTGVSWTFDRPSKEHKSTGDRRYLLTKIQDSLSQPIILDYLEDTSFVSTANRAGGLSFAFTYEALNAQIDNSDLAVEVRGAIRGGLLRLRKVTATIGTETVAEILFDHDVGAAAECRHAEVPAGPSPRAMNLLGTCRKTRALDTLGSVTSSLEFDRSMTYAYAPPATRAKFAEKNELVDERWRTEPAGQLVSSYGFTRIRDTDKAPYPQMVKGEVVATTQQLGERYELEYLNPTQRYVTWPVGGRKLIELNGYGSPTLIETPCGTSSPTWDNNAAGGKASPNGARSSTGHETGIRTDAKLRTEEVSVVSLPTTLASVDGLTSGTKKQVLERDTLTGVETRTKVPGAGGSATGIEIVANTVAPNGVVTRRTVGDQVYDETLTTDGVLLRRKGLEKTVEYLAHNEFGQPTRIEVSCDVGVCDGLQKYSTTIAYDGLGRSTSSVQTELTDVVLTTRYDGFDRVVRSEVSGGPDEVTTTSYDIDTFGALTITETEARTVFAIPDPITTTVTREQDFTTTGLLTRAVDEIGDVTRYSFSANECRPTSTVTADGTPRKTTLTYGYDARQNLVSTTSEDAHGRKVVTQLDQLGLPSTTTYSRVLSGTETVEATESFKHDVYGNVSEHHFGDGHVVKYRYSFLGELLRIESDTGSRGGKNDEIVSRDGEGKIRQFKTTLGLEEEYRYDVLGRVTRLVRKNQSLKNVGGTTNGAVLIYTETREYDDLTNPPQQTVTSKSESSLPAQREDLTKTTLTMLDDFGRPQTVLEGGATVATFTYDQDNARNVKSRTVTSAGSSTTTTYLDNGNVRLLYPGGIREEQDIDTRGYVSRSQVFDVGTTTTTRRYDGPWPKFERIEAPSGVKEVTRTFDDDGRALTETVVDNGVTTWTTITRSSDARRQSVRVARIVNGAEDIRFSSTVTDSLGNPLFVTGGVIIDNQGTRAEKTQAHFMFADGTPFGLDPDYTAEDPSLSKIAYVGVDGHTHFTKSSTLGLCVDNEFSPRSLVPVYGAVVDAQNSFGCGVTSLLEDQDYVGAYWNAQATGFHASLALLDIFGGYEARPALTAGVTAVHQSGRMAAASAGRLLAREAAVRGEESVALAAERAGAAAGAGSGGRRWIATAETKAEATGGCPGGLCGVPGKNCFVAGTPVLTENGLRAIEDVDVGDLVWSRDDVTGEESLAPVLRTFVTPDRELMRVELLHDNTVEAIEATPEHPWHVEGRGWVSTKDLVPGDIVITAHGGWARVGSTTWEQKRATVYNFEVEGTHSYFVGEVSAWVHNTCLRDRIVSYIKNELGEDLSGVEFYLHGTTASAAKNFRLETRNLFTAVDANIAAHFAERTVAKYGGQQGLVLVVVPKNVAASLRRSKSLIVKPIDDIPHWRESIFNARGVDVLRDQAIIEDITHLLY
jgi:hypothetical protein